MYIFCDMVVASMFLDDFYRGDIFNTFLLFFLYVDCFLIEYLFFFIL